jgi:hypothetical protein
MRSRLGSSSRHGPERTHFDDTMTCSRAAGCPRNYVYSITYAHSSASLAAPLVVMF